jgi:hypothetical protein
MSHLILLTALALYAIGLILASWRFGVGLVQTLASGIVTIAFVWVAFYLVYVSDVLYAAGLAEVPASVALESVPFAWLWQYVAKNAWIVGIVYYVPVWLAAVLIRLMRQRPNSSFKSKPLRGSA